MKALKIFLIVPSLALLLLALSRSRPVTSANPDKAIDVPTMVVQSFERFAHTFQNKLSPMLKDSGYHAGLQHVAGQEDSFTPELRVPPTGEEESKAGLYGASLILQLHSHTLPSNVALPEVLALEFVTHGEDARWLLLTENGFLFSYVSNDNKAELPFDLRDGVKKVAGKYQVDFEHWAAFHKKMISFR